MSASADHRTQRRAGIVGAGRSQRLADNGAPSGALESASRRTRFISRLTRGLPGHAGTAVDFGPPVASSGHAGRAVGAHRTPDRRTPPRWCVAAGREAGASPERSPASGHEVAGGLRSARRRAVRRRGRQTGERERSRRARCFGISRGPRLDTAVAYRKGQRQTDTRQLPPSRATPVGRGGGCTRRVSPERSPASGHEVTHGLRPARCRAVRRRGRETDERARKRTAQCFGTAQTGTGRGRRVTGERAWRRPPRSASARRGPEPDAAVV